MSTPMPSKEFTVSEMQSLVKKFNLKLATATTYTPTFNDHVYVTPPPVQVNPWYCLTVESSISLMSILADLGPVGYLDYPSAFSPGSPFYYTQKVPWFIFSNGAIRNAGMLAFYWLSNFGDPGGNTAEKNARMDIAWG